MAAHHKLNRSQPVLLAAILAVAGTLFFFDRLGALIATGAFSFTTILHASPLLLIAVGVVLTLADGDSVTGSGTARKKRPL